MSSTPTNSASSERAAPILRRLVYPTKTRARIYDRDGALVMNSRHLFARGQILGMELKRAPTEDKSFVDGIWQTINLWLQRTNLALYKELGSSNGKGYNEVSAPSTAARAASSASPSAAS